jgi:hypothetical protein
MHIIAFVQLRQVYLEPLLLTIFLELLRLLGQIRQLGIRA